MRKILLGTASLLAAATVLFSSIDAQAAVGDALTAASADFDLTNVFGPKMTAAGVKAYLTALDGAPVSGTIGIQAFVAAANGDAGISIPKLLDSVANKISDTASNWSKLASPVYGRVPLGATPQATFSATQWLQVKFQGCGIAALIRTNTQSTADPSTYIATDAWSPLVGSTSSTVTQTFETGLDAIVDAADKGTFFTSVIPAIVNVLTNSAAAATFNVYVKPVQATISPTNVPTTQYLEYLVSCFGVFEGTN